jgi:predicted dehydrogenase
VSPVRIAVIGAGHLGRIHARLLKGLHEFHVVAVSDPAESARQCVQQTLQLPTISDYRTLAGSIEAVVIASPTTLHFSMAHWALSHGIHALVEKPLVKFSSDATALVELARNKQCTLQVGHVERFNPAWQTIRPKIDQPQWVDACRIGTYTGRSTDIGVVLDLMIHDIDLLLSLSPGRIESIRATGRALLGQHEDVAEARIEFSSGCVANLRASRIARDSLRRMQVHGLSGIANIDLGAATAEWTEFAPEVASRRLQADVLPEDERLRVKDELFSRWLPTSSLPVTPVNAIEQELRDFAMAIRSGANPQVTGQQARDAIFVAEQILASIGQAASQAAVTSMRHAA